MKKSLYAVLIAFALIGFVAGAAFAEESSASGTVVSYSGKALVVNIDGEPLTLTVNEDTEVSGELKSGDAVYVEWNDSTALYIEVETGEMEEEMTEE